MGTQRIFLNWSRPLCTSVPDYLLSGLDDSRTDLRDTVIVVPTRQSSWRLRAALPIAAHARGMALLGPEIVTPPVLLSPPQQPGIASATDAMFAWMRVLGTLPSDAHEAFLGSRRNRAAGPGWALQIARRMQDLRRELADGGLTVADVAAHEASLEERARWNDMAAMEHRYLEQLAAWKLTDAGAAKLRHAASGSRPGEIQRILLAAVPDPPQLLLTLLARWAAEGCAVDVLVAAPGTEADAFDAWGRALPAAWQHRAIPLDNAALWLSATPEDTAARIAQAVGTRLPDDRAPGSLPALAIGVPDRETVAPLQRAFAALDLPAFDPQNTPFVETPLFRLVEALLAPGRETGYGDVAVLLRHPDVLACFEDGTDVLRQLDRFQSEHLPVSLEDLPRDETGDDPFHALASAVAHVRDWRQHLLSDTLCDALRLILQQIYAHRLLSPGDPADATFQQAVSTLDATLRELDSAVSAGHAEEHAGEVLLARLRESSIKSERGNASLNLEGWLELAWNPEPMLYVAGMNEGLVPDGHVGDLFLPDTLRQQLGLRDDRLRMARDACLLNTLLEQRREDGGVILALARMSASGDPLRPSRLLFRCDDAELVDRARLLFQDPPESRNAAAFSISFQLDPGRLPAGCINRRRAERISPTLFRAYLSCPLRFYLQQVLGMEPCDDRAREPDARTFGNWIHDTLDEMAKAGQSVWGCEDAGTLAAFLSSRLQSRVRDAFGSRRWLGVELMLDSACRRLEAFAAQQVGWARQGWEIIECEQSYSCTINGLQVNGRIDRIDRNRQTGEIAVLDYKTTDHDTEPGRAHIRGAREEEPLPAAVIPGSLMGPRRRNDGCWTDLQLPIYREFVRSQFADTRPRLGYVLIPDRLENVRFSLWDDYSDSLHASAIACAEAVAHNIRDGIFWPPGAWPAGWQDDFKSLLLDQPQQTLRPPPKPWGATP